MRNTAEEPPPIDGEVYRLVEQTKELQEIAASLISRTTREEDALRQRVASLDSHINSLLNSKHTDKDRTAYLFLCLPTLLLVLRSRIWDGCLPALPVQLYQAWLLYLYTGLALRENILRVNGSDIRPWWIKHHYCAMVMALISLTWEIERGPNCAQKQIGVELFLKWAIMQGVAMILQNIYQRQRLYTRIALGKARRMDVVWGETAGVAGQLLLLCPILFVLQGFEAYIGVLLLKTALVGFSSEWQVITCGILLIIMAVGNFVKTVQTLVTKSRVKAKIRRGKSRQELSQVSDDKTL
ncbi:hypothetical protein BUALT_Bualt01G0088600 [Buddleja alternifolia]|uniref:TMPIT-like protein n=1 Tax=Buddleja alternifolia TaxID=168488 RepID=A0AAV6YG27_9LAMI|nr:hypothetical protein BUALT_Bualt01G0088600 [Buddleja alternifolia]